VQFVKSNYPQVRVLECEEDLGFALAGNVGAKTATGDLVAFLSNDLVARPDWILQLVEEFRAHWPRVGAVSPDLRTRSGEGEGAVEPSTLNFLGLPVPGYFEDPKTLFHPEAHSFVYARFLAPDGPFDPDYISLQSNVYLGWRLRSLDREVRRSAAARVFRGEGGGVATVPAWKSAFYRDRNRWLNLFLFFETANLVKVLPWILLEALGGLVRFLLTDLNGFLGRIFALAWFLTHPLTVVRKRRAVQEKRRVPDRSVLRCMSGRVARDRGPLARLLNFFSLLYCLAVGLEVMEFQGESPLEF
jgi:GT2 family glycosyltransferase